jgi:hypothetical protein
MNISEYNEVCVLENFSFGELLLRKIRRARTDRGLVYIVYVFNNMLHK